MNNTVDKSITSQWSIFGKFVAMEFRLHKRIYLLLLGLSLAMTAIPLYYAFDCPNRIFYALDELQFITMFIILVPLWMYRFIYNPAEGLTYHMLPTTHLVKVLSAWLQSVIVVPILMFGGFFLALFLGHLMGISINLGYESTTSLIFRPPTSFFSAYFDVICVQAFVFLGIFWFRHKKEAWTFMILIVLGFLFSGIAWIFAQIFGSNDSTHSTFTALSFFFNPNIYLEPLSSFRHVITPVLPWILAYIKFTRTQV